MKRYISSSRDDYPVKRICLSNTNEPDTQIDDFERTSYFGQSNRKPIGYLYPNLDSTLASKKPTDQDPFIFHLGQVSLNLRHKLIRNCLIEYMKNCNVEFLSNEEVVYTYGPASYRRKKIQYEYAIRLQSDYQEKYFNEFLVKFSAHAETFAKLFENKHIILVVSDYIADPSSIVLDVYLNSKLLHNELTDDPCDVIFNKYGKHVSTIMNYYFENDIKEILVNDDDDGVRPQANSKVEDGEDAGDQYHLFDSVYFEHQREIAANEYVDCKILKDFNQLPILRKYQINAIQWMLKKEYNVNYSKKTYNEYHKEIESQLHPLYVKLTDRFNQTVYYHKFNGVFTLTKPSPLPSVPGGILAEEMGLGKTLEILGCILLNPCHNIPSSSAIEIDQNKMTVNSKLTKLSCLCTNVAGVRKKVEVVPTSQCRSCGLWLHMKCVNYTGDIDSFICPLCCPTQTPYASGCTLIVTPAVISHQWLDEIKKHVRNRNLSVVMYKGCSGQGYIHPQNLAKFDIVITTYDVLASDLNHVWSSENAPNLRNGKRFMSTPSPLICIDWWRICLDEAQMVHNTNARCAEMVNRLHGTNRWCVTGTPIGKSISDLHGLFTFIREDPFYVKRWFDDLLMSPFKTGNRKPMIDALTRVLWRTTKKFVLDQINIPEQIEQTHWLGFTKFESHLYERVIEKFKTTRHQQLNEMHIIETVKSNARLDELDRATFNKFLAPLLELRLTCDHPQLILQRAYTAHHNFKRDKLLTMVKSLEILAANTKSVCEQKYRSLVSCLNGLAGLNILEGKYNEAIEIYEAILKSEKDYDNKITIDNLQKIHALYNLNDVLVTFKSEPSRKYILKELNDCENKYLTVFDTPKNSNEEKMWKKTESVEEKLAENEQDFNVWWLNILNSIEKSKQRGREFFDKFSIDVSANIAHNINTATDNLTINHTICGKRFTTFAGLKIICADEYQKFLSKRQHLLECLNSFRKISNSQVLEASFCHLNGTNTRRNKQQKCELCECDVAFSLYAKHLFSQVDEVLHATTNENEDDGDDASDEDENERNAFKETAGIELKLQSSTSDLEKLFKLLISFCRNDDGLSGDVKAGKEFLDTYNALKDEFRVCRQYWVAVSNQVNALDEISMAKIRMRLKNSTDAVNSRAVYIIEPHQIQGQYRQITCEKAVVEAELRTKLGQLMYQQNLIKSYTLKDGRENEEVCPICQHSLGSEWYVLVCGHSYCKDCLAGLIKNTHGSVSAVCSCSNCLLNSKSNVRCALCRETSSYDERFLVRSNNANQLKDSCVNNHVMSIPGMATEDLKINEHEFDDIKIRGNSNSTKIEGVVKCLKKIQNEDSKAKCLVFSQWPVMLELIQDSLKMNGLDYRYLKSVKQSEKLLMEFKNNENMNILLMPYSYGANGLNLIEATHVLIVEPNLNISQEIQAIGRVHRIGQTRQTFVHRFLVRNTIEEICFRMFIGNSYYKHSATTTTTDNLQDFKKTITIADVHNLILSL